MVVREGRCRGEVEFVFATIGCGGGANVTKILAITRTATPRARSRDRAPAPLAVASYRPIGSFGLRLASKDMILAFLWLLWAARWHVGRRAHIPTRAIDRIRFARRRGQSNGTVALTARTPTGLVSWWLRPLRQAHRKWPPDGDVRVGPRRVAARLCRLDKQRREYLHPPAFSGRHPVWGCSETAPASDTRKQVRQESHPVATVVDFGAVAQLVRARDS